MPKKAVEQDDPKSLASSLYKQNVEILGKNKTLSLLSKLYEISILTLEPKELSLKVSEVVQNDLSFESVGVFLYDKEKDEINSLNFKHSERVSEFLQKEKVDFSTISFSLSKNSNFEKVVKEKAWQVNEHVPSMLNGVIDKTVAEKLEIQGHIKTVALYPLLIQNEPIGILYLSFNRSVLDLSESEMESVKNTINVIAVALDKSLLYEKLKYTNEQLKALDKARAEFISIASHQLRTPPATIKWYLGAILNGDFGEISTELTAALTRTNVTNDAQIATIDDLLNASRIERGKLEFFFAVDALEPVVATLVEQMLPLAQMKKMMIEYNKPSGLIPEIMMDKEKVRQVINNMIDNAIKYSKGGTIRVDFENDGVNQTVKVTDNGKGIAKQEIPTIFEKYTRGHDSVTHATGLGLGMYVAKVIVEQHNGKIWAESPGVGKGATFAFSLPIQSNLKATTVDLAASAAEHQ